MRDYVAARGQAILVTELHRTVAILHVACALHLSASQLVNSDALADCPAAVYEQLKPSTGNSR